MRCDHPFSRRWLWGGYWLCCKCGLSFTIPRRHADEATVSQARMDIQPDREDV
jgi:hypothetical protein